ncbi:MAG: universal stress protein [Cyanothece sp. SIO2G6]|nr:universal stress protein [Cyanothece sp. SIO2G6]
MFKTVLFPIDQTRESRHAADLVANIVKTYNSSLTILAVVEPASGGEAEGDAKSPMQSEEAIAKLLDGARQMFSGQGVEAKTMHREGKPAFVICDVADDINADLIIMGSHGVDMAEGNIGDSVSDRVINLSPCPVLIVP